MKSKESGEILISMVIAMLVMMMVSMAIANLTDSAVMATRLEASAITINNMASIKKILLANAKDVDKDGTKELYNHATTNQLPSFVHAITTDGWGKSIYYHAYKLGAAQVANASMATDNSIVPPGNIIGVLVSSGADGTLQTTIGTDWVGKDDDILLPVYAAEAGSSGSGSGIPGYDASKGGGAAIMWTGNPSSLPDGFQLCDGTGGFPDYRGYFLVGYGGSAALGGPYAQGASGGEWRHLLATSEMPSHDHSLSGVSASGAITFTLTGNDQSTFGDALTGTYNSADPNAIHSVTAPFSGLSLSGSVSSTGGGGYHENRPQFRVTTFICKQ